MASARNDTIAAVSTPPGAGAIAVVRVSGPEAVAIARRIAGTEPLPRRAMLAVFHDVHGRELDHGLVLFFPGPRSYTGEDVVEFHGHGGPVTSDWLLETLCTLGARPAEPGEFTLRAFLNDKLDLAQAEATADLIDSGSRAAARAALRSLDGEFSKRVDALQAKLTDLRVLCEAWLDFPEEELDAGGRETLAARARALLGDFRSLAADAAQGVVLHDGLSIAIAGPANAGKSSLLNRLAGYDAAIVTEVPGTTRDTIRERLSIGGLPLNVVDTAGLRETRDPVEIEGLRRAQRAIRAADHVLWVADIREGPAAASAAARRELGAETAYTLLLNKVDLTTAPARISENEGVVAIELSALTGAGIELLAGRLKAVAGWRGEGSGTFSARRRHIDALARAERHAEAARDQLAAGLELAAEELRGAQAALGELTGELTSDDLLGKIFSSFCIGK